MELIEGIIISISKYKDNDLIFNILTNNGYVSVLGVGALNKNSKLNKLNKTFLLGQFDLYKGPTKGYKIRDCLIKKNYSECFQTLEEHLILDFIEELTFKCLIENNDYTKYFDCLISSLNSYIKTKNYFYITRYFAQIIKYNGICFDFNHCDGDKYDLDFTNGEILEIKTNNKYFDFYRTLFLSDNQLVYETNIDWEEFKMIIINLNLLSNSFLDINLNSLNIINTI